MAGNNFDVIIIGAGISGIDAGYRLQEGIPDYKYAILEGRSEIGGTWSLFKYPGIRSDSDLHTFGFPWDPWREDRSIADAQSILNYVRGCASRHGIDKHVKYNHQVQYMDWSSENQHWKLSVLVDGSEKTYYARHILLGTGYYDYKRGLNSHIPGLEDFKGTVVHPQFWPEDLDYSGKKVVVIGSGATAVTLVPSMTEKAKSVTMLQRSPSYFLPIPLVEPIDAFIKKWVPGQFAYTLIRWKYIMMSFLFFNACRLFPNWGIKTLRKATEDQLPENIPFDPHFVPSYLPWQQRMCITPGGDFFAALRTGKADVVTDIIRTVDAKGINLESGAQLDADIIVTATGLKIQFGGGMKILVDGKPQNLANKFIWRGACLQDLPNLTFIFGYTNASWTLGADATAQLWVRIMKTTRAKGQTSFVPRVNTQDGILEKPLLNLNSSYIKAAEKEGMLPKGGDRGPWVPRSWWLKDIWHANYGDIQTGLQFYRVST